MAQNSSAMEAAFVRHAGDSLTMKPRRLLLSFCLSWLAHAAETARTNMIHLLLALSLWGLPVRAAAPKAAPANLAPARPNIIFVLTDDQGYGDLGVTGNPVLKTPHIDGFAKQSVRFTDFHVSPTCAPTRAALMTGRHEFKNGVTHTINERERMTLKVTTIAQVLKRAGYRTGIFGKWHLGDEPEYQPNRRGFDEVFIHGGGGIGQTYVGSCGDAPGNKYFDPAILHNGRFEKTAGYCTDVFFAQALKWMEKQRQAGAPFFTYISLNAPHAPLDVPDEYFNRYKGKVPENAAKFFGMIENIDDNFGALLKKIDEWGLTENTLMIFMTDNGGTAGLEVFNAGMRGGKATPYQGATRVPSFWRWPAGFAGHADCAALTAHLDVFPTFAEIAHARITSALAKQVEGRSLMPLLKNPQADWPDRFLVTHVGRWERGHASDTKFSNCSIRDSRFTLVNNKELYDLKSDYGETTNVIERHADEAARLRAAYNQWWKDVQALLVNENAVGPKVNPFKALYWKQFGRGPDDTPKINSAAKINTTPGEVLRTAGRAAAIPESVEGAGAPHKELFLPGQVFQVDGHTAFVILPPARTTNHLVPWVWYAPTLPGLPGNDEQWMFERFTLAGIAIAGIDVGESYGSPAGRALYSAFHEELIWRRGFAPKAVLLGRSRGGLMTLSWAAENPEKVAGFAGIYPVCNVASYPSVAKAAGAYQMTPEELSARLTEHNPIDRLAPLALAGVPLFAIHGDVDKVVPLEANSGLMRERYRALGGSMELIIPPGQGHNMWAGFFQSQELVNFVKSHAGPNITLQSPLDHQVIQRSSKKKSPLSIRGELAGFPTKSPTAEARLIVGGQPGKWRRLAVNQKQQSFGSRSDAPAGGWHRLEVRALSGADVLAESVVEHVGVGEVFVVAGQSNSANHGEEKQQTRTGLVAAFDGQRWRPANDPQPGASGGGGSFIPPFGDAIAEKFRVPVGIMACGVGATSVREWLPEGAKFPNPPTLTGHVRELPDGGWESKGSIFVTFSERMKQLGPRGFRAVLWHQGESDANQADATRTLPGKLYRDYLMQLIRASRREIGWNAPWFAAQASYHVPGDEASPDIRAAQASLWKDGLVLAGPDTDALKGELRDSGGKGVHFSGPGLREHAARWVDKVAPWLEKQ